MGLLENQVVLLGDWPQRTTLLNSAPDLSNWRECCDVNVFATLQMNLAARSGQ